MGEGRVRKNLREGLIQTLLDCKMFAEDMVNIGLNVPENTPNKKLTQLTARAYTLRGKIQDLTVMLDEAEEG